MADDRQLEEARRRVDALRPQVAVCMTADRRRFRRRLRRLRGRQRSDVLLAGIEKIAVQVAESKARAEARRRRIPCERTHIPLPIDAVRHAFVDAIRSHACVIVAGETGSGKTSRLPQFCLDAGYGVYGTIAHTQPRRVAARSVAARIASELGDASGDLVGHKVRFDRRGSRDALIQVMTDGMLLAELPDDPRLERYDVIIIDEAHERSLNIDFLLGCVHRLLAKRPDLKVIITSATIDTERFSAHFNGAPVINVEGRTHPVEMLHAPHEIALDDLDTLTSAVADAVVRADAHLEDGGDVLVFLPGEREIRACCRHLRGRFPDRTCLPLHARLSLAAQQRVLRPAAGRRIICATNVAETSLTVPSVRSVIDSGLARIGRWSAKRHVHRLPVEPVSKASTMQRAGRAGRVAPGVCVRLFTESDWEARPDELEPEIRRTDLAGVLLRMASLDLGAVGDFPFLDPPRRTSVQEASRLLHDLGALEDGTLTSIGRDMARLPVEPRVARMLLAARSSRCVDAVLVIAAGLAVPDPRLRPPGSEAQTDAAHQVLAGGAESDFQALHAIWERFRSEYAEQGAAATRRWCQSNHLSWVRMLEWRAIHGQLRRSMHEPGMIRSGDRGMQPGPVHRALLAGLIDHVARLGEDGRYEGAGGRRYRLHPSSMLARKRPPWVMAAEVVETGDVWARTCAAVHPSWIVKGAPHLVDRAYTKPRWELRRGCATAEERVSLRGLTLTRGRRVNLEPIDPALARAVFIDQVLIAGGEDFGIDALADTRAAARHIGEAEERLRAKNLRLPAADERALWERRLPPDVIGLQSLKQWASHASEDACSVLRIRSRDLLRSPDHALFDEGAFPRRVWVGPGSASVRYRFSEGADDDGVTIRLPLAWLETVMDVSGVWMIPGYHRALVACVLRGLPKPIRVNLQPVSACVDAAVDALSRVEPDQRDQRDPLGVVAAVASRVGGYRIAAEQLARVDLPAHLVPHWEVEDDGRVIASGRDLNAIRRDLMPTWHARLEAAMRDHPDASRGHTCWAWDVLPTRTSLLIGGVSIDADIVLSDQIEAVDVEVMPAGPAASRKHERGVRRLASLELIGPIDAAIDACGDVDRIGLLAHEFGGAGIVRSDARMLTLAVAGFRGADIRTQVAYRDECDRIWGGIGVGAPEAVKLLADIWQSAMDLRREEEQRHQDDPIAHEMRGVRQRLLGSIGVAAMDLAWARQVPLWLQRLVGQQGGEVDAALESWGGLVDRALAREMAPGPSLVQMVCLLEAWRAARRGVPGGGGIDEGTLREQWSAVVRDGGR